MLRMIKLQIAEARKLPPSEAHSFILAVQRILIQHYCIGLAEWLIRHHQETNSELTPRIDFDQLRRPSDGTLVSLLCDLTAAAENAGWKGISRGVWEPIDQQRPCLRLLEHEKSDVEGVLNAQVRRRNSGPAGHGLPGGFDIPAEIDALEVVAERLKNGLPIVQTETGRLFLSPAHSPSLEIRLLKVVDGKLLCFRSISSSSGGKCRIKVQRQLSAAERDEFEYEADDILSLAPESRLRLAEVVQTSNPNWSPLASVPDRQTDLFAGRTREMDEIADWFDDSGSRACLVYGDGGIGKTTFSIECVHRLLEGKLSTQWRPELISYYTAKRTRWGINGLEIINPSVLGASDALLALKRALEGPALERDWFTLQTEALVQKLSGLLKSYGVDRANHLMIIDNAETLAQSEDEVKTLSKSIREISRHVGRVLVTSRRREEVEARFVEMNALSDDEAEQLIRARGHELKIKPIEQAGSASLRHYARKLGCKPLVLEVFIQVLTDPSSSLERAFSRVMQMQSQDLGEFLYSDAWQRLSIDMKHLLLLMTRVADVHDEVLVKLCASEAKVSVLEAYRAIDQSRGIATVSRQNGVSEVVFLQEFIRFCADRTVRFEGRDLPTTSTAENVRRRYAHFLTSSTKQIRDRIAQAFRHPLARAAYRAVDEENHPDAELFYELATIADSSNAALFDRYAYYLSSRKSYELALDRAIHATQLEPGEAEYWLTRGIIESKSSRAEDALVSLAAAQRLGKASHVCALHIAHAYMKLPLPDYSNARAYLKEASKIPAGDTYRTKHLAEVEHLRRRLNTVA